MFFPPLAFFVAKKCPLTDGTKLRPKCLVTRLYSVEDGKISTIDPVNDRQAFPDACKEYVFQFFEGQQISDSAEVCSGTALALVPTPAYPLGIARHRVCASHTTTKVFLKIPD